MDIKRINWFGLIGGILIVVLVVVSYFLASPWWQLSVAEGFVQANFSPLTMSFSLLGIKMTVPLIWALNVTALLSFTAAAIVMLIYSIVPTRSYSMHLLGFAWKKPLYAVIIFVVSLFVVSYVAGSYLQLSIPVAGTGTFEVPTSFTGGAIAIKVPITTGFTWTFALAAVAAGFCVAARVYHRRIVPKPKPVPVQRASQTQAAPPPPPPPPEKEEAKV